MKRLAPYLSEIQDNIIEGKFEEMMEEMMKHNDFDGDGRISDAEFHLTDRQTQTQDTEKRDEL